VAAYLKIVMSSTQLTYRQGLTLSKEIFDSPKARYQVPQDEPLSSLCSQFHGFKLYGGIDLNKITLLR